MTTAMATTWLISVVAGILTAVFVKTGKLEKAVAAFMLTQIVLLLLVLTYVAAKVVWRNL